MNLFAPPLLCSLRQCAILTAVFLVRDRLQDVQRVQVRHRLAGARRRHARARTTPRRPTPSSCSTARTCRSGTNGDKWMIKDGYAIAAKSGITTKDSFGDCQLHLEFATPEVVKGSGQGRGNSGVYLMEQVRGADPRLVREQDLLRRPVRVDLQAAPADGERQPQAGRVADVRHRLRVAAVREGRASSPGPATSR